MRRSFRWSKPRTPVPVLCLAAALALSATTPAQAEVTVTSKDGSAAISGELVSFDGKFYTIRSIIGELTVPVNLVDCVGEECPELDPLDQKIRSVGSNLLLSALLPEAIDEFSLQNDAEMMSVISADDTPSFIVENAASDKLATFDLSWKSPGESFSALLGNEAEMALVSRRITNREIEAFIDAGLGDLSGLGRENIVAQDALVVVTSPDNFVDSLTLAQLEGVFSGRIDNWSALGGPDTPINVYAPALASGEAEFFAQTVLEPELSEFAATVQHIDNINGVADQVMADPAGIGLTSTGAVRAARVIPVGSECGIVSTPDDFSVKSEDYPLSRRLYVYTTNRELPTRATQLVELLKSDQGQEVVEAAGLTSLATSSSTLNTHGNRLAYALSDPALAAETNNLRQFVGETLRARRLSVTFRFSAGSSRLDNKAQSDIERLIEVLGSDVYRGREVLLIGFTDSIGQSSVNKVLSTRRARQVLDQITAAANDRLNMDAFDVQGYGASTPVACNDTDLGRQLNRRVEVWVR